MKKLFCWLLVCLILSGCGGPVHPETTEPTPTEIQMPTESPKPWIETAGTPWDDEGTLTELALTIPDGLHYTTAMAFDGDLLFWSVDDHRNDQTVLELCLLELDTGTVSAQIEVGLSISVFPQILGDSVYLSDWQSGTILELNKELKIVDAWSIDPVEGNFYMGADEILYIYNWNGNSKQIDLKTGEESPLLAGDPYVDYFHAQGNIASIQYFHPDTGAIETVLLDLTTNTLMELPVDGNFTSVSTMGGTWLFERYRDGVIAILGGEDSGFLQADIGYDSLKLISSDLVLCTREDGRRISLHDLTGKCLVEAELTEIPYSYNCSVIIPSESFGGYFLLITDYSGSLRLLYWNTDAVPGGEDIPFEIIPEPGEEESALLQRVEELEKRFGLEILTGSEAGTLFVDFSATQVMDWLMINDALNVLEKALSKYPDGFLRQLRYDTMRNLQIHLVTDITATTAEYVDTYEAFVQYNYDGHLIAVDINQATEMTYFHELSHVIDSYLQWEALAREDALFSEETWNSLNPAWFPGYTYDYSWRQYVQDYTWFVDDYATIKPTEDRARIMQYAMADYGYYMFDNANGLIAKLDYYARCIRDAFDTTGWPEKVLWEQYLP